MFSFCIFATILLACGCEGITTSSLPKGWSNPGGNVLTNIRNNVWLAERPFYPRIPGLTRTDVGGKMAVIKLPDGSLWVHSPVELDNALESALNDLGPVRHIVTPNTEHQKFARQWILRYPNAISYVCPGLKERKPEIGWDESIGVDSTGQWSDTPPASWGGVFDMCWIDAERGPFMNRPFFSEVIFNYRPSKVLLVTDLFWNYPSGPSIPTSTKLWKFGMDVIYAPFYNTFMQIKPDFESRLSVILNWDFDTIAPCHGDIIFENAKTVLSRHLGCK